MTPESVPSLLATVVQSVAEVFGADAFVIAIVCESLSDVVVPLPFYTIPYEPAVAPEATVYLPALSAVIFSVLASGSVIV